jgi:hypothetical protein
VTDWQDDSVPDRFWAARGHPDRAEVPTQIMQLWGLAFATCAQASSRCACAAEARTQRRLICAERHRRVRSLLRVHADHHHRHDLPLPRIYVRWNRGGHALLRIGCRRTSYEPRHGKVRQADTSFESRTANRSPADMRTSPAGPLNATTSAVTSVPILQ